MEDTIEIIRDKYLRFNSHAESYTWKRMGHILKMNLTLEENGVLDESTKFDDLLLAKDTYIPALHLYYNDDLTVA